MVAEINKEEFPTEGVELSILLVVKDIRKSTAFYKNVLGAELFKEYGGTTSVFNFRGSWIILVTGGEPTKDKPGVFFAPPSSTKTANSELTIRVPDCHAAYKVLKSRGAIFLTPPVDWGGEIRCFFRDPDGHLFEFSELVKK